MICKLSRVKNYSEKNIFKDFLFIWTFHCFGNNELKNVISVQNLYAAEIIDMYKKPLISN